MKKHHPDTQTITDKKEFWQVLMERILEQAKELFEEMIEVERDIFVSENQDRKNGYRKRDLITGLGKIEGLKVGRTRNGGFQPSFIERYQRRALDIDELIISLYQSGVSTRKIAKILEKFYGAHASPALISSVTDSIKEKMKAWKERELKESYLALYIDAAFFNVRRDVVEKEAVYFVLGIDEQGIGEIVDYFLLPTESATGWEEILNQIKERGIKNVEVIIADGLSGLDASVQKIFPQARFQLCWQHKIKNILLKVRVRDRDSLHRYLESIYRSETKEKALRAFELFKKLWMRKYPDVVKMLEKDLPYLLNFYHAPLPARKSLYTTNLLERAIKEFKRRIKIIDSLPSPEALEKLIFLRVVEFNQARSTRRIPGFSTWFAAKEIEEELNVTHFS